MRFLPFIGLGLFALLIGGLILADVLGEGLGAILLVVTAALAVVLLISYRSKSEGPIVTSGSVATFDGVVDGMPQSIRECIESNVHNQPRFTVESSDDARLKVKIGWNFFTWGEIAKFDFRNHGEGETRIQAECRHRLSTVIIDFGQSRRDLSKLLDGIPLEHTPGANEPVHVR